MKINLFLPSTPSSSENTPAEEREEEEERKRKQTTETSTLARRQMSFAAEPLGQRHAQDQARGSSEGALPLTRLDELLERYEKITEQRGRGENAPSGGPRSPPVDPSLFVGYADISAGGHPEFTESKTSSHMGHPSPNTAYPKEKNAMLAQSFMRTQAGKIPDAVNLLADYLQEPKPAHNSTTSLTSKSDPLIRTFGLSMFVDNYAPDAAAAVKQHGTTFDEADAMLESLHKVLNEDLLRCSDLGATRQVGNDSSTKRNTLAQQATEHGVSSARNELLLAAPVSPAIVDARSFAQYTDVSGGDDAITTSLHTEALGGFSADPTVPPDSDGVRSELIM